MLARAALLRNGEKRYQPSLAVGDKWGRIGKGAKTRGKG